MALRLWESVGGLLLLAALVIGLALPGSAADVPQEVRDACEKGISGNRDLGMHLLRCASRDREGIQNCCYAIKLTNNSSDNCTCGVLRVFAQKDIDVNEVCNTTGIGDMCRAREEEAAHQAQETEEEDELMKLEPCARFFKRFAGGEVSVATLADAVACIHAVKKSPASCKKPQ